MDSGDGDEAETSLALEAATTVFGCATMVVTFCSAVTGVIVADVDTATLVVTGTGATVELGAGTLLTVCT